MRARRHPILYVHHRQEAGGAPQSLVHILSELDTERFEPFVYCPPGTAAELFSHAGATIITGPVACFTHIWASTYSGARWALLGRELERLWPHCKHFSDTLSRYRFSLVHLNDAPLVPAAAIARRAGLPVVWHLRSALPDRGRDNRSQLMRLAIRRLADVSIAINHNVSDSYAVGSVVISNAVDLHRFVPGSPEEARARLGLPPERPIIGFFGFFYPLKGYLEFIHAARLLKARSIDVTCLLVGGPVRGRQFFNTLSGRTLRSLGLVEDHELVARELVAALGLEKMLRFVEFTPDISDFYRASDIVAAPSRGPELGRPVLEAAATGRPVVASGSIDGGGVLLPDETGFLVPRRSPEALAAAFERLLENGVLRARMGTRARAHAVEMFDATRNAARLMEIYDDLLGVVR